MDIKTKISETDEKYSLINWSEEEKEMLIASFDNLDSLVNSCLKEKNSKKILAFIKSYEAMSCILIVSCILDSSIKNNMLDCGVKNDVSDCSAEENKSNLDRAKKYFNYGWTDEQKNYIHIAFGNLDKLMHSCEKERASIKIEVLSQVHMNIHDILLSFALEEMY